MKEKRARPVTVLAGPARSGKTARVVELFVRANAAGRSPLVLAPDSEAARAMRRRLLARIPVLATDSVSTFVGLSERILAASGSPATLVSSHERELVLRGIVSGLLSSGRLRFFAGSAAFDGFYAELAAFIAELKSCQIEPEAFRDAAYDNKTQRDRELAEIYRLYQRELEERGLYDTEGRFWQARIIVETSASGALGHTDVFLDGFSDFTANELALLGAFAGSAREVLVTLPYDSKRHDLFEKTFHTLGRLKRDYVVKLEELPADGGGGASAIISRAFMEAERAGAPAAAGGGLKFFSTAGARMEVEEIAREAKRLILSGQSAGDIAVITRSPGIYRDLSREVFAGMGVPLDAPAPLAFAGTRLYALLSSVVSLAERDFERETVIGVLASPYVDLPALGGRELSGADVVRFARDAGVVAGFGQWQARLAGLEAAVREASRDLPGEDEEAATVHTTGEDCLRIAALRSAVARLKDLVEPFERDAPAPALARELGKVMEALGVRRRILEPDLPEETLFADLASCAAAVEALEAIGRSRHASATMNTASVLKMVSRAADEKSGSGALSAGGVAFHDVVTARNLSYPVVFLCGVLADSFPAAPPIGPFYSRNEREQLAGLGLVTRSEQAHLAAERLLFYQAVTRADETLYVSYPASSEAGKPKLASFYLDDLKRLFVLADGDTASWTPSRLVKAFDNAASARELEISAGDAIAKAGGPKEVAPVAALACRSRPSFAFGLRGAAVEARREGFEDFDYFDGVLTKPAVDSVRTRFSPGRPWSGTSLTRYRGCPFHFFLTDILGVERKEEPDVVPTPLDRGAFAHELLARFFTRLRDEGRLGAVAGGDEETLREFFDEAFRAVSAARQTRLAIAGDPFWEIEKGRLRVMLTAFVDSEVKRLAPGGAKSARRTGGYVPAFFEISFGERALSRDGASDKHSRGKAVEAVQGGLTERLCGRIDRVDYCEDASEAGAARSVAILDYKLSNKISQADVRDFVDMQIPVYLFAAPSVVPGEAIPREAFCRTIRKCEGSQPVAQFDRESYAAWRERFVSILFETVERIRGGDFRAKPAKDCPPFCIGRGICRMNEGRLDYLDEQHG